MAAVLLCIKRGVIHWLEIYQFIIFYKHKRGLSQRSEMKSNSKRRRTATTTADITLRVTDLPVGILVDAASYTKPSSALFAVSMSAPSTSWQNNNSVHRLSAISEA